MYLVEYRFFTKENPVSTAHAIYLLSKHLEKTTCPEEFIRWREWEEDKEESS